MTYPVFIRLDRRWLLLGLAGVAMTGTGLVSLRLQSVARDKAPEILRAQLSHALGRPVEFGKVEITPLGVRVADLRVPRAGEEQVDPLTAARLNASIDWWRLFSAREVHVSQVVLDDAAFRIAPESLPESEKPWTAQLASISRSGLRAFRLNNASIRLFESAGGPVAWASEDVSGDLKLRDGGFAYSVRAGAFDSARLELAGLRLSGTGDAEVVHVKEASAEYQGGRLSATGRVTAAHNAALLTLKVQGVPLSRLARELQIPAEWAAQGRVTGEVDVDARDKSLRSVRGVLTVERGAAAKASEFPWKTARARLVWTPEKTVFSEARVDGQDIRLTGQGEALTPDGAPFTQAEVSVSGEVHAARAETVARLADLLAFQPVRDISWKADQATVRFQAKGRAGNLTEAAAAGHLVLENFQVRPPAAGEWLKLGRAQAAVERTPEQLALRDVSVTNGGVTLTGELGVTDASAGDPGRLAGSAVLRVADLKSLERVASRDLVRKWLPVVTSNGGGEFRYRFEGPLGDPAKVTGDGTFSLREFRLTMRSPLPNSAMFFIPVRSAAGSFKQTGNDLVIPDLDLKAETFDAQGKIEMEIAGADPLVRADLRMQAADWRHLPAMASGVMPEMSGGRFESAFKVSGPYSTLHEAPVSGTFRVLDGAYRAPREGAEPIPVRELAARFHWDGRVMELPEVTVESPLLSAKAAGRIYPDETQDYRLALDIAAEADDAGELNARFTDELKLAGGKVRATGTLETPVERTEEADISGTLELSGVRMLHAFAPLGLESIDTQRVSLDYTSRAQNWRISRLDLEGPGLTLALEGSYTEEGVDADVEVTSATWMGPVELPVVGGSVALSGHLRGDLRDEESLLFFGDLRLKGAEVHYTAKEGSLKGGRLDITAKGDGKFTDIARWAQSGEVSLVGGQAVLSGQKPVELERLAAAFRREGEAIHLSGLRFLAPGITASGEGEWSPERHTLRLTAETKDFSLLPVTLPKELAAKSGKVVATVTGTGEKPLLSADGRLELDGVELAVKGIPAQSLERIAGGFHWTPERLQVTDVEARGPVGMVMVNGEAGADGHRLTLSAAGEDVSRLGVELAKGFELKRFALLAEVTGDAEAPVRRGTGTINLGGVAIPFGPEGPHRLDTVTARLAIDGSRVEIRDILGNGPAGRWTGTGWVTDKTFRIAVETEKTYPQLARFLLPGTVTGGSLAGTVVLEGPVNPPADAEPVGVASGRFILTGAQYVLPKELPLSSAPLAVSRFSGDYRYEGGRTLIKNMVLESDLLGAQGTLDATEEEGRVLASIRTGDMGRVADYWPQLAGKMKGGSGTGELDARFNKKSETWGTLALRNTGGTLALDMPEEFGTHPVETASALIAFEPNKLTYSDVQMRGPKGNLDGEAVWTLNGGTVYGKGKAWFSKEYSSKMIKPTGFGWLAKLIGLKEIKSDFTLGGTSDRVMLNAGITKKVLWKFAKGRVPKEFRDVATGKAPLYVEPEPVAETDAPTEGETHPASFPAPAKPEESSAVPQDAEPEEKPTAPPAVPVGAADKPHDAPSTPELPASTSTTGE